MGLYKIGGGSLKEKIVYSILSLCIVMTLVSCTGNQNSETKTKDKDSDTGAAINDLEINSEYDFRKGNWGESRATIESREGELLFTAGDGANVPDMLSEETIVHDHKVLCSYGFINDRLKYGTYNIASDPGTRFQYLEMFENVATYLTNKYGTPVIKGIIPYDQEIPRDTSHKDPVLSVDCANTQSYAIYETTTSDILLLLAINNGGADFVIVYTETDFFDGENGDGKGYTSSTSRLTCDFRNAKWGDSRTDILKYEPDLNIVDENSDTIMASGTVGGYPAAILYFFDDEGKLRTAGYGLALNYTNPGQYIPVYNDLKDKLSDKYGEAVGGITPLGDQQMIDMLSEGQALEYGFVTYTHMWQTETTGIMLSMSAEEYEITLMIRYLDLSYEGDPDNGL